MKLAIRRFKRIIRQLSKSLANALRAFQPNEVGYRLAIRPVNGFEIALREGTADESVIADMFEGNFLGDVPEYKPNPGDVVLDVGAHIGTFALLAAKRIPLGSVHAIEASRETFDYLRINKVLNGADNIQVNHLALSDREGEVRLYHDDGNWGHSVTARLSASFEMVKAETLGGFMLTRSIERVHFAKFNCEGAEFPILLRTSTADLQRIGAMLVLYHSDLAPGYDLTSLVSHLEDAGFRIRFHGRRSTRGRFVAVRDSLQL